MTKVFLSLALCLFASSITAGAAGQANINGSLRGRGVDANGASVLGAAVTLTNPATNNSQTTTTNADGEYIFARVAPGNYSLAIEKAGFRRTVREGIVIAVNEAAVADVVLTIGEVSETVTVESGANVVQSQSVEISGLVNERRISPLPAADRTAALNAGFTAAFFDGNPTN